MYNHLPLPPENVSFFTACLYCIYCYILRYLEQCMMSYTVHGRHSVAIVWANENTYWVAIFVSGIMLQGKVKKRYMALSLGHLPGVAETGAGKFKLDSPNCASRSQEGNQRNWHLRLFLKDEQVFARQGGVGSAVQVWTQYIHQHGTVTGQRSWIWPTYESVVWGKFR